jgi:hypothetical protein
VHVSFPGWLLLFLCTLLHVSVQAEMRLHNATNGSVFSICATVNRPLADLWSAQVREVTSQNVGLNCSCADQSGMCMCSAELKTLICTDHEPFKWLRSTGTAQYKIILALSLNTCPTTDSLISLLVERPITGRNQEHPKRREEVLTSQNKPTSELLLHLRSLLLLLRCHNIVVIR